MIAKISEINDYIKENLSAGRYRHSLSAAVFACALCGREGVDPLRGYVSALLHDVAREWPQEKLKNWAFERSLDTGLEPVLYHGEASAEEARLRFGITDAEMLFAIRHHTFGHPDLGALGKILFVADYCEYERIHIEDEERKELLSLPLDQMVVFVIKHAGKKFTKPMNSVTMDFYNGLERG